MSENVDNANESVDKNDEIIPSGSLWGDGDNQNSDNPFDVESEEKYEVDKSFDESVFDDDTNSQEQQEDDTKEDNQIVVQEDKEDNQTKEVSLDENNQDNEISQDSEDVSIIIDKIDELVVLYKNIKDENSSLQNDIKGKQVQCDMLNKKIVDLEDDLSSKNSEIQSILKKVNNLNF